MHIATTMKFFVTKLFILITCVFSSHFQIINAQYLSDKSYPDLDLKSLPKFVLTRKDKSTVLQAITPGNIKNYLN